MADPILVAVRGDTECHLLPALANRHGLITGATGTGKTVTLQTLAEGFSRIGVPVFLADVKGDLTGISQPGARTPRMASLLAERGLPEVVHAACPVTLWDVFGQSGHPVRATVSDLGPLLLSRMLALNETQQGVLNLVFKIADDNGLALLDLKDLRTMLAHVGANAKQFTTGYGNVSAASIGAIQRGLLQIEQQGGDIFFGEPMLDIADFMQTVDGAGVVNILAADRLMSSPRLYATFLLWMLSELFESLPEVGDLDRPKLVFFFDEAHLLFKDAPAALVERIELVVRLVRSKGVGVYFVTQNPIDVPDSVLAQLGNRVQHALRAFTPRDQKAVRAAAETMRANPMVGDIANAIMELAVGEALVSTLDAQGRPGVTQRVFVVPPGSQLGPISAEQRQRLLDGSIVAGVYDQTIDRVSAYEKLTGRVAATAVRAAPASAPASAPVATPAAAAVAQPTPLPPATPAAPAPRPTGPRPLPPLPESPSIAPWQGGMAMPAGRPGDAPAGSGSGLLGGLSELLFGRTGPRGGHHEGLAESAARSAMRSVGSAVGREIARGVLGSLLGGGRR
jgi:DNA helicase HerA-like ATPase